MPSSDEDADFTRTQLAHFDEIQRGVTDRASAFRLESRNSGGILGYPAGDGEIVRAGLMLYGVSVLPDSEIRLRPVLTWKTRVTLVRDLPAGHGVSYGRTFITPRPLLVASLAAGYGDGYPRQVSGHGAAVLIGGRRCPILGRVTMDQIMADVTGLPAAPRPGDEAVLLGCQEGAAISATALAGQAGLIPWQLFTGITRRTVRRMPEV